MQTSLFLARLLGPLFLLIALAMLVNRTYYQSMATAFLERPELYYLSGVLAFIAGLAIVLNHNLWVADWRVILTVMGWASLIKGAARLLFPAAGARLATSMMASMAAKPPLMLAILAFMAAIGGWLTFRGYSG